ncbi:Uma2 family endonuclease [Streptomyces sp. NPDC059063]|uniref:Uma2 family endonuclease n=1 Tax=unclassified Streptomyces TaxID=2593676 RepID=UPI00368452AB
MSEPRSGRLRTLRPRPGNLREVAEKIEEATGLRVQILGGKLVMSPTPRGKHAGVIARLRRQLDARLPEGLAAYEVSSIALPDDPDDYVTPDLLVLPTEWEEDDDWLAAPEDAALAVEVISKSERSKEIRDKVDWYAGAGVTVLVVVDPRHGTWTLYAHPKAGAYQEAQQGKYGETIPLPQPLAFDVETNRFPLYGEKPRG